MSLNEEVELLRNVRVTRKLPFAEIPQVARAMRHAEQTLGDDGRLLRWRIDLSASALQARLRAASPVCLEARQRVQLLGESEALAEASASACLAR